MLQQEKFRSAFAEGPTTAPRTLVETAYLQLRRDIVEGHLAPGVKLRVEHLKDRYAVGAGTLREALAVLISDALVVSEGQRGYYVAPISQDDLDDVARTRILLETEALRLSIRAGDDEWEARLIAAYHRLGKSESKLSRRHERIREWEQRNREFHEALISACGSRWLLYTIGLMYRQSERYRHLSISSPLNDRDVHAEHAELHEASLARDARRACKALERHIRLTCESLRLGD